MKSYAVLFPLLAFFLPQNAEAAGLNYRLEVPDTAPLIAMVQYMRVKQGDTHTIDLYEKIGWNEAIEVRGDWPSFCTSQPGFQRMATLNAAQQLQGHDPSKPINSISVDPRNGIIYASVKGEGVHTITYNAAQNLFSNIRLHTLSTQVYASHIYHSYHSRSVYLVLATESSLERYDITDPENMQFSGSVNPPAGGSTNPKTTILSVPVDNLLMLNIGSKIFFFSFESGLTGEVNYLIQVQDLALDLHSGALYVALNETNTSNVALFDEDYSAILSRFKAGTLGSHIPIPNQLLGLTLATNIHQIEASNYTLVVSQLTTSTAQPFYVEYYRANRSASLVEIKQSTYPTTSQPQGLSNLLLGTNFAMYWMDSSLHVFPVQVKDELFYDSQYVLGSLSALAYYEPAASAGRVFHAIGEKDSGVTVLQVEYALPTLQCSPSFDDKAKKYDFQMQVVGRRCEVPGSDDPSVVCVRQYAFEIDVVDEDHAGLSRAMGLLVIVCSLVIVGGIIIFVIVCLLWRKKKREAQAYARLPLPRQNTQESEAEASAQVRTQDVRLRGFEQAAVREDNKEQ